MASKRLRLENLARCGGVMLGLALLSLGGATPAAAQTYVCPPGYYFLANYGCYPFGGYSYYSPPPPAYYYPPTPYYAYPQPQYGFSFQFGGRDHDDHDRGDFGRGEHRH